MSKSEQGCDQVSGHGEVLAEWIEPHLPTVFTRWHRYHERLQRASSAAVIAAAGVRPGDAVLDIGSGAGIPALEVARVVGPEGRVVATDPSPIFVAAVLEHARQAGLGNVEAIETGVTDLPFDGGCFDAATCHMGVMFFPDVRAGLGRIRRVLRPGGRAGFVVWGPEDENAFFGSFWDGARPYLPAPPPGSGDDGVVGAADAPGPMRFAAPGSLSAALTLAGFGDVREETRVVEMVWPGPVETLFEQWTEISRIESRVALERRSEFRRNVLASLRRYADGETVRVSAPIVVASGAA